MRLLAAFLVASVVLADQDAIHLIRDALPRATTDCPTCLGLLTQLKPVAQASTDTLITTLTGLCVQLGVRALSLSSCSALTCGRRPLLPTSALASSTARAPFSLKTSARSTRLGQPPNDSAARS